MKKLVATALAAGALAGATAASAQDLGSVIANVLGFGTPQYSYTYPQQQMYRDNYGRTFYYDQYGRQVYVNQAPQQIVGYDQWGRPVYNATYGGTYGTYGSYGGYTYGGNYAYNQWDRDGDGVANQYDRWPDDRRYR